MPTARLISERPIVEFTEDGMRILKNDVRVDLGVLVPGLTDFYGRVQHVRDKDQWQTVITVPAGFVYDGASIPKLAQIILGDKELYEIAGVIHDWLYRVGAPRDVADHVFWIVARSGSKQVGPIRGWLGWAGLRIGGWVAYRKHRRNQ